MQQKCRKKSPENVISLSPPAYSMSMKRRLLCLLLLLGFLPVLAACRGEDYEARISEIKRDIFCAQTEDFTLTVACLSREYPYADDGVACAMTDTIEVTIAPAGAAADSAAVYAADGSWGGDASFSSVHGDFRFSQGVTAFPEGSVDVRVVWGGKEVSIAATSVRTPQTISPEEALSRFVKSESEALSRMEREGVFCGEFRVRLLRRDKNYYYIAVTDGEKHIALLLDAQTGETLARREK